MFSEIWKMEEQFWLKGLDYFDEHLSAECLMALPGLGALDRHQVLESMRSAPRWDTLEMLGRRQIRQDDVVVLAYDAVGGREGAEPYRATCTSTYHRDQDQTWRMIQHQQTPVQ